MLLFLYFLSTKFHLNIFKYVFFDVKQDVANLFLTVLDLIGLVFLTLGVLFKIITLLKRNSDYKRIYNKFISSGIIKPRQVVLISNSYYLLFKNENDAKKMESLLSNGTLNYDYTYNTIIKYKNFKSPFRYADLSRYLKKKFDFNDRSETIFFDEPKNDVLIYPFGSFELFIEYEGFHLIKISKIIQDKNLY